MPKTDRTYRGRETQLFCAVVLVVLVVIAFLLETGPDRLITLAMMCCALVVGYAVGVFITPYDAKEKSEFLRIGKFLTALVTGFLLAKIEPVVGKALSSDQIFTPTVLFRLTSVTSCFLLALIGVFVHRKYVFSFNDDTKSR